MDSVERTDMAKKIFEKGQDLMIHLFSRWQDEKEYEDIQDYAEPIKANLMVGKGIEFVKMSKRPWGFIYKLGGATYQVCINTTEYYYKRIA